MRSVAREYISLQRLYNKLESGRVTTDDTAIVDLWEVLSSVETAKKYLKGLLEDILVFRRAAEKEWQADTEKTK